MSISINCPTHELYGAVDNLIQEIHKSPRLGLKQFYALLSSLPGFKNEGRTTEELKCNSVRVFYNCTQTDRLAVGISVRWERVYQFLHFLMPRNPSMPRFSVHFRDEFAISRSIYIFAQNEMDAIQTVAREGYGHAGGIALFPTHIEKVVSAAS